MRRRTARKEPERTVYHDGPVRITQGTGPAPGWHHGGMPREISHQVGCLLVLSACGVSVAVVVVGIVEIVRVFR